MNIDEYDVEREPSAPIEMLEHYFPALGWACERTGEEEIVSSFQGSWSQYELRAIWRKERGKQLLANAPRPPLPDAVRTRRKTGFTLPIKEWLSQDANGRRVEFGKRSWARKVYEVMFGEAMGYW